MGKCDCSGQTCGCVILAGDGVTVTGSGTVRDNYIISAAVGGGGGGGGGWEPGDYKAVAHGRTPAGWLECMGQAISRTAYSALFDELGTTYGSGDNSTTFNLPNYAGRVMVGAGSGFVLGAASGQRDTTLEVSNLPPHKHVVPSHTHTHDHTHAMSHSHGQTSGEDTAHLHTILYNFLDGFTTGGAGVSRRVVTSIGNGATVGGTSANDRGHQHTVADFYGSTSGPSDSQVSVAPAVDSGPTGTGTAFTNMPPYRVARVLIKT